MPNRGVDRAMMQERPEKTTIRERWIEIIAEVEKQIRTDKKSPLYVTLAGAEGKDIECLINRGIIKKTETGAISTDDKWKVVAIEKNGPTATELRRKYPGLDVRDEDVLSLIRGNAETLFPNPNHKDYHLWKAPVINLDYNSMLKGEVKNGKVVFEVTQTLKKISTIHHEAGSESQWYILLTLNANINLDNDCWREIKQTLKDNMSSVVEFKKDLSSLIPLNESDDIDCDTIKKIKKESKLQQNLLLALIPKYFSQRIRDQRWEFKDVISFAYGNNTAGRARMASWIICIEKPQDLKTDEQCYQENVGKILKDCSFIDDNGKMSALI